MLLPVLCRLSEGCVCQYEKDNYASTIAICSEAANGMGVSDGKKLERIDIITHLSDLCYRCDGEREKGWRAATEEKAGLKEIWTGFVIERWA